MSYNTPNLSNIKFTLSDIAVDTHGRTIIDSPKLTKAIKEITKKSLDSNFEKGLALNISSYHERVNVKAKDDPTAILNSVSMMDSISIDDYERDKVLNNPNAEIPKIKTP